MGQPLDSGLMSRLGGSLSKLSTSSTRLTAPKLKTIQLGLAADLNPENYAQQQNRMIPIIPTWQNLGGQKGGCLVFTNVKASTDE